MLRKMTKSISLFMIISFLACNLAADAARAGMIGTETALQAIGREEGLSIVTAFLEREDVRQAMTRQGVDVLEAQKRVAALSEAELHRIAQQIDQLPAGGDGVGTVVGALLLVFLVLLVTDILGLTHVYPFVTRR
ncbi:MAG: hypothetical protein C4563_05910 [Desulfobulbus sp.]|jgi:hypothetical protein|nr:MAG: hypothetical protein C4563_05910 [Desulfobulbus sp.]